MTSEQLEDKYRGRQVHVEPPDLIILDGWFQLHELEEVAREASQILRPPVGTSKE